MAKRVSTRKVKKDRLYTYETAGEAMNLTSATVRSWRVLGLVVMTERKPHFILGEALIEFVEKQQTKQSSKPCLSKMRCFTCREQKRPLGTMVDYIPITDTRGQLVGLCETCEGPMYRFSGKASLSKFDGIFDIAIKGKT